MRLVRGAEFSCVSPTGREERPDVPVHLLGYLFDPGHAAIVAEQSRLRDRARRRGCAGSPRRWPPTATRWTSTSVFALLPEGTERRAAAPGARAGRGGCRRVGERGVRHAAAQRQPVLRAQGRHAGRDGRSRWCGPRAASRCSPIRWPAVAAGWWSRRVIAELADGRASAGVEVDHPDHAPDDRELLRGLAAEHDLSPPGRATTTARTRPPRSPPRPPTPTRSRRWSPGHRRRGRRRCLTPDVVPRVPSGVGSGRRRAARARLRAPARAACASPRPGSAPGTTAPAATG